MQGGSWTQPEELPEGEYGPYISWAALVFATRKVRVVICSSRHQVITYQWLESESATDCTRSWLTAKVADALPAVLPASPCLFSPRTCACLPARWPVPQTTCLALDQLFKAIPQLAPPAFATSMFVGNTDLATGSAPMSMTHKVRAVSLRKGQEGQGRAGYPPNRWELAWGGAGAQPGRCHRRSAS